ncbi:aminotransferase class I/II-fold pyridoxal phosphate-dependent enzyme [Cyanobium sp. NIES-981]|uniref:aminotransferase class I/II-fold pyridoxal phosphate-dependent enzyme n=1 Tax=Cyanobium sp. NIES-981 TaxID=1851505 RepID=UPI0007DD45A3|nr:aminotransferase class I/II-fold pyridoxal phosphate-dependent enzyme [Cyanobium sp. NIES-981]SBO41847.1 Aminotransferases class-I [Cyanobium sp. NIES-981]
MTVVPAGPGPAARLEAVLRPVIPELAALVARTPGTLSLAQGMVGWGPPAAVAEAVGEAFRDAVGEVVGEAVGEVVAAAAAAGAPLDHYGAVAGDPELLAALATLLRGHHGIDLSASTLMATAGSNMAFHAIAQVICDSEAEVILPLPYYFNHVMAIQLAGGRPVPVDAGLIPDPDRLAAAITPRTRAIVTVSPNNPSGVVMPRSVLAEINALCARHGLLHISDEAYALFVHGTEPHWSPGALPGSGTHTVTLQTLSKAYGMAGWRVGFMAAPRQLAEALAKVQDTVLICPPRLMQRAAVAALEAGPAWCAPHIRALADRRRQLLAAVAGARAEGLPLRLLAQPEGAFYGLLAVEAGGWAGAAGGGLALMRQLVLEHRVATIAGECFGLAAPACGVSVGGAVLRLSYGLLSESELEEALRRLFAGVRALVRQRSEQ